MSKKGFAPIVIVLIIALLTVGGAISYIFIKNKQPNIIGDEKLYEEITTISTTTTITIFPTTTTISPTTTTKTISPTTTTTTIVQCEDSVTFTYKGNLVTYGTVKSHGRCWLDRNLGASRVATAHNDSLAYGDLFQWGRLDDGHQTRTSGITTSLSGSDNPGHSNFIYGMDAPDDWRSPQNNNLWQGISGINNPCPLGWRLPVLEEWDTELASWSQQNYNGAFASPLKLTAAGSRYWSNATLYGVGNYGFYWSNPVRGTAASNLLFDSSNAFTYGYYRAYGFSIRCLKD